MKRVARLLRVICALVCAALLAQAQEASQQLPAVDRTLATLHGIARNAVSGEPIPRVLVRIEGDARAGTLTDGEGRFEITGVPVGPQSVEVLKPGYFDAVNIPGETPAAAAAHSILVASGMPDVAFSLVPAASIRGQIDLSAGDPAEGITVTLLHRMVEDGRGAWIPAGDAKTRSDGSFRFGSLAPGDYALYTHPAMESEAANFLAEPGSEALERRGYPSVFYPAAPDLAGAAKVHLAAGDSAQANFTLPLEPFHTVMAAVTLPGQNPSTQGPAPDAIVMDAQGAILPYEAQYDAKTRAVQVLLPDGNYSLLVTQTKLLNLLSNDGSGIIFGSAEFVVSGHPVTNLRVPLAAGRIPPVETIVERSGAATAGSGDVIVMLSLAGGGIGDGMMTQIASGKAPGVLPTQPTLPGTYWVHTHVSGNGLCEASFTAGGASLAREPLAVGLAGVAAPFQLTLRDDCASLRLGLPPESMALALGEESYYTVYVVPDFDSTGDLPPTILRPSTGGAATLQNLTPGNYHVYTAAGPMHLEYRNPQALANLPSQAVTLSSGASADLTVEAPQP